MKKLITAMVFIGSFGLGFASYTPTAECRQCNSKKCFWDSDCGRTCACIFPGGKSNKKGFCAAVGD